MAAVPPVAGALQWDQAVQSGMATQNAIPTLDRTPEAYVYARAGVIVATTLGYLYIKTTDIALATGWVRLAPV